MGIREPIAGSNAVRLVQVTVESLPALVFWTLTGGYYYAGGKRCVASLAGGTVVVAHFIGLYLSLRGKNT